MDDYYILSLILELKHAPWGSLRPLVFNSRTTGPSSPSCLFLSGIYITIWWDWFASVR